MTGKQKFQRGNKRNMAGKAFNFKLGGETSFLGGSSFYLGGAVFQRGRYWGVFSENESVILKVDILVPLNGKKRTLISFCLVKSGFFTIKFDGLS